MKAALDEAIKAYEEDEVPVGAVIVHGERLLGRGHNQVERLKDATAHAEILALGAASEAMGDWRLEDCTLYVTLEPCVMCFGASCLARVGQVVYGAPEPRFGACGSQVDLHDHDGFLQRPGVIGGILEPDCRALVQEFFRAKRRRDN